jgi:hypothetical protein
MSIRNSRSGTVPPGTVTQQETMHVGRRADLAPTGRGRERQGVGAAAEPARRRPWLIAAAAVFVILAIAAGVVASSGDDTTPGDDPGAILEPSVGSQEYLKRLANQGYIPKEAVDQDLLRLERLVARGDIPAASLEPDDSD